jgi:hypothetical protein
MRSVKSFPKGRALPSRAAVLLRVLTLLVPAALLLLGGLRVEERAQQLLWAGAGAQAVIFLGCLFAGRLRQPLNCWLVVSIYALALVWLWLTQSIADDWFSPLAQFLLLAIPLGVFAIQSLDNSGAIAARRANILAQRLAQRKDWPADLRDCQNLPEVKAFREALAIDATPALNLLHHARPQVRMAALAALEYRQDWRPDQVDLVLRFARQTTEPLLRAAAVTALGNLKDRALVEKVAEFLQDPAPEVRQATTDVLFWDCERRWNWIRPAIHQALADPARAGDGPLTWDGPPLPPDAQNDLIAWCAEKGPIAIRAAQTLSAYYHRLLDDGADPGLLRAAREQVNSVQAPPALRIEMAQLLHELGELDRPMQEQLLDPANPAPLRLLAAECLLAREAYPPAILALREIARMPNREMALNTAKVVQRRLGIDLGLALGQPLPPLTSRQAADVMRRLMKWSTEEEGQARDLVPDASTAERKHDRPGGRRDPDGFRNLPE